MENLRTESIKIQGRLGAEEYQLKEKDYGDQVVYDIFHKGHYLLTMSPDGSILFMNFDAEESEKEIFKLSHLNQFISRINELA